MKGRAKREEGGRNLAEADEKDRPMKYTADSNVQRESEERKKGGRAKRKAGGIVHHEKMDTLKHAKHVGKVHGEMAKHHAGRSPRKDGGRTGSPFSAAHKGENPAGRKEMDVE